MKRGNHFGDPIGDLHAAQGRERSKEVADFQSRVTFSIYSRRGRDEAGILKVDFICRTPASSPLSPHRSKVMEIFGSRCDHIKRKAEFVSAEPGWRYWVVSLSAKICTVKPLLLSVRSECGCDPWLDAGSSAEVYEGLRKWLHLRDESKEIGAHWFTGA